MSAHLLELLKGLILIGGCTVATALFIAAWVVWRHGYEAFGIPPENRDHIPDAGKMGEGDRDHG